MPCDATVKGTLTRTLPQAVPFRVLMTTIPGFCLEGSGKVYVCQRSLLPLLLHLCLETQHILRISFISIRKSAENVRLKTRTHGETGNSA